MEILLFVFAFGIYWFGYCRGYDSRKCGKIMTKDEIDKAVKEIREHCRHNNCRNCEAYTIHECVFMNGSPDEWFTIEEADKEGGEEE